MKYGFLISVTTMFGGSTAQLFAQTDKGEPVAVESNEAYKRQFLQSVAPDRENIRVDFMVDSVDVRTSNGTLLPDVNVIQLLAYLDTDSDEYQSYMANRHIVAHEMWHRICMMNDVLEKPMAASQYRNGRDNFEISASIVQLLTFRDDYIRATPEERVLLHEMEDPKIRMYLMAVDNGIVRPFSDDKKDFDFEMEFIAKTVSGYWNGTLAYEYAPLHNTLTEKSGRKEFSSPAYDKNFNDDIKKMNLIGGIDFSKLYNFRDVRLPKLFEKGYKADTTHLEQTPGAPNYEAWITQKSQLKRYSRQTLELPNFTGNRLVQEREARPKEERVQPFKILPMAVADKIYPYMKHPLSAAVQLVGEKKEIRLYPHGAIDIIGRPNSEGVAKIKTVNLDGSYETGQLLRGRKNGTFIYFNRNGKEISHCTFRLGRALDGAMVLPFQGQRIVYRYEGGVLQSMDVQDKKGNVRTICTMENGRPLSGLVPTGAGQPFAKERNFQLYQDGNLLAEVSYGADDRLRERQSRQGRTLKIERFYPNGKLKYEAAATFADLPMPSPLPVPFGEKGQTERQPARTDAVRTVPVSQSSGAKIQPARTTAKPAEMIFHVPAREGRGAVRQANAAKLIYHVSPEKNMRIEKQPGRQDNTTKEISGFTAAAFPPARQTDSAKPVLTMRETLFMPDGKPVMATKQQNGKRHLRLKLSSLAEFLQKSPLTPAVQRAFFRKATTGYPADGAKMAEMRKVYKTLLMAEFIAKKANRRTTARQFAQDLRTPTPAASNNGTRRQISARRSDTVGKRPSAFKMMTAKARLLWQRASRFGKNV